MTEAESKVSVVTLPFATSRPSTAAVTNVEAFSARVGRQRTTIAVAGEDDPYALLYSTPANEPPSLVDRQHSNQALFAYYAVRGYKEVVHDAAGATAFLHCLSSGGDHPTGLREEEDGTKLLNEVHSASHALPSALDAFNAAGTTAPIHTSLRPPKSVDLQTLYVTQQTNEAKEAAEKLRVAQLHLPPSDFGYMARFYPSDSVVAQQMVSASRRSECSAAAAAIPQRGGPMPTGGSEIGSVNLGISPTSGPHRTQGTTPSKGVSGSQRSGASKKTILPILPTPLDVAAVASRQHAARNTIDQETEKAFIATHYILHPDAEQRKREMNEEDERRRSKRAATLLMADVQRSGSRPSKAGKDKPKKKKKKKKEAAPPRPEGSVPSNLLLLKASLLTICDANGSVNSAQLEDLLMDSPFEVVDVDAIQQLFNLILSVTQARQSVDTTDLLLAMNAAQVPRHSVVGDTSFSTNGARRSIGLSSTSRRPTSSRRGVTGGGSSIASGVFSNTQRPSLNAGVRTTSTSSIQNAQASGTQMQPGRVVSPSNTEATDVTTTPKTNSGVVGMTNKVILVREVLAALDALLNSSETRQVLRWACFQVLAVEGNGYIHRSQLAALRRQPYRDNSAAADVAVVSASMVKSLDDAFAVIAAEEEAAFSKAGRKGKRKAGAKGGVLPPHMKSQIPLHMMRVSHMNFEVFCRFFDELPQIASSFSRLWLPLLLQSSARGSSVVVRSSRDGDVAATSDGEHENTKDLRKSVEVNLSVDAEDGFPIQLLGATLKDRRSTVHRLVSSRLELLRQGCAALEEENNAGGSDAPFPEHSNSVAV